MITKTKNNYKYNTQKIAITGKCSNDDDLELIAIELDKICRMRLPDGVIRNGRLVGMESEIRQQALIKMVGGFIQNNTDYINALESGDKSQMHKAMTKCVAIAIRYSKEHIYKEIGRHTSKLISVDETNGGTCQHASQIAQRDLPADIIGSMVMTSVHHAVREGRLSAANAIIVEMVCIQGLRVCEVASRLRVKPPAISQHLRKARTVIPEIMANVEVPWNS